MTEQAMTGEVVWFNDKLGYGFTKPDDGSKDLFLHYTNIVAEAGKFRTLTAGQKISFTVGSNNTGPQAENIVILDEPEMSAE